MGHDRTLESARKSADGAWFQLRDLASCRKRQNGCIPLREIIKVMTELNANEFQNMLDLFVLGAFANGPRSRLEIQRRVEIAERLLIMAAARQGKHNAGSVAATVERLTVGGCLRLVERTEQSGSAERVTRA